jgi:hypothetical protein
MNDRSDAEAIEMMTRTSGRFMPVTVRVLNLACCFVLVACGEAEPNGPVDSPSGDDDDSGQDVAPVDGDDAAEDDAVPKPAVDAGKRDGAAPSKPVDGGVAPVAPPTGRDGGAQPAPDAEVAAPDVDQPDGDEADYKDPGKGEWTKGTPDECGLDIAKLKDTSVGNYAVFRRGKLCHIKGGDAVGAMYSATKTLGGTMAGRAAYLTRDVMRTGPGTGTILHEDKATDWLGNVSYNKDATLAHVMAMCGHSRDLAYGMKMYTYDTVGSTQINTMIGVTEKAIKQVPGLPTSAQAFMKAELFDKLGMTKSSWSPSLGIASGWNANLSDMGKLGTLLLHDGYYGGERLLSREWVYRMSHPAFEDSNTSYGNLAWLNHRGNAAGIGGNISSGANAKEGDPCAPAAFWAKYPHVPSGAPDCRATVGKCEQKHDVGIFSAQGLNGQFIVIHPGLDLVIAARNFSGGDGPLGLWAAVRPALVAKDPTYQGDEAAFCAAYGAGDYAPDLVMPRVQPAGT